jgi:hypothetical protein
MSAGLDMSYLSGHCDNKPSPCTPTTAMQRWHTKKSMPDKDAPQEKRKNDTTTGTKEFQTNEEEEYAPASVTPDSSRTTANQWSNVVDTSFGLPS